MTYEELLEVFWKTHDPTTLNKQGADEGPQYRSVIFYHDEEQKKLAEEYKRQLDETMRKKIVTEISPLTTFYLAEPYHQDYFRNHPYESYCMGVVRPKVAKFKKEFKDKVAARRSDTQCRTRMNCSLSLTHSSEAVRHGAEPLLLIAGTGDWQDYNTDPSRSLPDRQWSTARPHHVADVHAQSGTANDRAAA